MTEKELSYVTDAIMHEESIIEICKKSIEKLDNDDFISFMENEISTHQNIYEDLISLLRSESNG